MARHHDAVSPAAPGGTRVSVDRVHVGGAPAGITARSFDRAVRRALEGAPGVDAGAQPAASHHIPRLQVRLPAGASESDIADAISRAIVRRSRGAGR